MNLYKLYAGVGILLALCTYESEAGLILLLLIKIIMLKGAIFFGMPLALGSFLMGQGMGFFKGSLFGGYTMLHAASKYHGKGWTRYKPAVIRKPTIVIHSPPHHQNYGWGWTPPVPTRGWQPGGWDSSDKIAVSAPVTAYHFHGHPEPAVPKAAASSGWGWTAKPQPSFLYKLTTIPSYWVNRVRDIKKNKQELLQQKGWGWDVGYEEPNPVVHVAHGGYSTVPNLPASVALPQGYSTLPHVPPAAGDHVPAASDSGYDREYQRNSELDNDRTLTKLMKAVQLAQKQYGDSNSFDLENGGNYDTKREDQVQDTPEALSPPLPVAGGYPTVEELAVLNGLTQNSVPPPNPLLENFLERKLREEMETQKSESRREEAAQLIKLLREAYVQELVDSLTPNERGTREAGNPTALPEFVPFPTWMVPNSTTAKATTTLEGLAEVSSTSSTTSTTTTTAEPPTLSTSSPPSVPSIPTPPVSRLHRRNPLKTLRHRKPSILTPVKPESHENTIPLTKRTGEADSEYVRHRRQSAQLPPIDLQALSSFTDDVKKFFLLVSLLDQDKCLQKLVCEVHTKPPTATLTPYESNIVVTFKVMNVLLPSNVEDSTTNYRKAAKIGELSKNAEICGKAYPTCSFSTDEIVSMGNQVAATEAPAASASGGAAVVTPSAAELGEAQQQDQEAEGSEVQVQTVPMRPTTTITAMPRV